jgi:hypothetical protein
MFWTLKLDVIKYHLSKLNTENDGTQPFKKNTNLFFLILSWQTGNLSFYYLYFLDKIKMKGMKIDNNKLKILIFTNFLFTWLILSSFPKNALVTLKFFYYNFLYALNF